MPCDRPGHYHEWPLIADMVLTVQRCERYCGYCVGKESVKKWKEAARLRRHVENVHIRPDGNGTHPHIIFNPHWKEGGNPNKPPKGFRIDGEPRKQPVRSKESYQRNVKRVEEIEAAYPNPFVPADYAPGSVEDRDIRVVNSSENEGQSQGHVHANQAVPATNNQAPNGFSHSGPIYGASASHGSQYAHHPAPNGSVNLNTTPRQTAPAYVSNNEAMHHAVFGGYQTLDNSDKLAPVNHNHHGAMQPVGFNATQNMAYQQKLSNTIVSLPQGPMGYVSPHHAAPYADTMLGNGNMIGATMSNVPNGIASSLAHPTSNVQQSSDVSIPYHSNIYYTNAASQPIGTMAPPTGMGLNGLPPGQGYYNYAGILTPISDGRYQNGLGVLHNGSQGHQTPGFQGTGSSKVIFPLSLTSRDLNMGFDPTTQQNLANFGGHSNDIQDLTAGHVNGRTQNTAPTGNINVNPDVEDFEFVLDEPTGNTLYDPDDNDFGFADYRPSSNGTQALPVKQNNVLAQVLYGNLTSGVNNGVATAISNTNIPATNNNIAVPPITTGANNNTNDPDFMDQVSAGFNAPTATNNQQSFAGTSNGYTTPKTVEALFRMSNEELDQLPEYHDTSYDGLPGGPSET
ncbi:hypothetical protein K470DRAFT_284769 [Piedraia hortae CBS 480.64]|uniref:Uncharacterized protein n=1 Tax=Piedraia hortae CBS 480.64 TaxID=1314780 RepID=A0A6A7BQN3_9PEZI|nr:hypothetical protein K470DRAFT_284769 [Piedraia hortae CBS 480.64]